MTRSRDLANLGSVNLSNTYVTQSSASSTYATRTSPVFAGTANFSNASVIFNSASVSGLSSGGGATVNSSLLYNGAMQVNQRSAITASITGGALNNYYTVDRWKFENSSSFGNYTQTVENDAPTGSGFRKSLKMLCTSHSGFPSGGTIDVISQVLEGQDCQAIRKGTASAKQLTLSFWVKSNATRTCIVELADVDNSRYVSASYTTSNTGTWEYKTITFPADTTGVLDNDNNASLRLNFWLAYGSTYGWPGSVSSLQTTWGTATNTRASGLTNIITNDYWQITGIKLEIGTSATDYNFKPFQEELRECQRYYTHSNSPQAFDATNSNGAGIVSRPVYGNFANTSFIPFPVPMRATPTVTVYNTTTGASGGVRLQSTSTNITAIADRVGITGFGGVYVAAGTFTTTDYAFVPFKAEIEL